MLYLWKKRGIRIAVCALLLVLWVGQGVSVGGAVDGGLPTGQRLELRVRGTAGTLWLFLSPEEGGIGKGEDTLCVAILWRLILPPGWGLKEWKQEPPEGEGEGEGVTVTVGEALPLPMGGEERRILLDGFLRRGEGRDGTFAFPLLSLTFTGGTEGSAPYAAGDHAPDGGETEKNETGKKRGGMATLYVLTENGVGTLELPILTLNGETEENDGGTETFRTDSPADSPAVPPADPPADPPIDSSADPAADPPTDPTRPSSSMPGPMAPPGEGAAATQEGQTAAGCPSPSSTESETEKTGLPSAPTDTDGSPLRAVFLGCQETPTGRDGSYAVRFLFEGEVGGGVVIPFGGGILSMEIKHRADIFSLINPMKNPYLNDKYHRAVIYTAARALLGVVPRELTKNNHRAVLQDNDFLLKTGKIHQNNHRAVLLSAYPGEGEKKHTNKHRAVLFGSAVPEDGTEVAPRGREGFTVTFYGLQSERRYVFLVSHGEGYVAVSYADGRFVAMEAPVSSS